MYVADPIVLLWLVVLTGLQALNLVLGVVGMGTRRQLRDLNTVRANAGLDEKLNRVLAIAADEQLMRSERLRKSVRLLIDELRHESALLEERHFLRIQEVERLIK